MDIKELLKKAITERASDLHIQPELPPILRIEGDLVPIKQAEKLTSADTKKMIYSMMSEEQKHFFEQHLIYEFALSYPELGNFRVSALHQFRGLEAVFRVIPEKIPTFEELGFPTIFKRFVTMSYGLLLVTGPTGSGKSTTLASMVDFLNNFRACHIITIEDPIEYVYHSKKSAITQLQVGRDTPDVATALRAALRQDPDVILLSEMRDLETIRLALTAAETGHLVMATLHASSAPLAISRMVDVFPTAEKSRVRNLLSETLQAVVCQTLVKKINNNGRIAAFEIMLANSAIRHLVRQDMIAHMESTIQTSGDIGMCTMEQYLQELVFKQQITLATARSVVGDRMMF